jgi:hypothetical protein
MATREDIPADTPVDTLAEGRGADTPEAADREPEAAGKTSPAIRKCSR